MTPLSAGARVRRRDGSIARFDPSRIARAVNRAAIEVGCPDSTLATILSAKVTEYIGDHLKGQVIGVEDIQDLVEKTLMESGPADVARAYILYREHRAQLRDAKRALGIRDELKLELGAVTVLAERYLLRDGAGRVVESTGEMLDRTAHHVAAAEDTYQKGSSQHWAAEFSEAFRRLEFLPNSPTLMNAGTRLGLLSACFVLPLEDSLASIFTTLGNAALIHQAGGGTGYSFSRLRPAGDRVASTGGQASGPTSFLNVFDAAAEVVREGGRRRGANMAVLDVSHPDLKLFVEAKLDPGTLGTFNLSVAIPDRFMRAVLNGGSHRVVHPRTGRTVARPRAAETFEHICEAAWASGDPGMLFIDQINRHNPVPVMGQIDATNPCGEVPLLSNESCNLASLNLTRFVSRGAIDWSRLADTVRLAIRFLDDVIDVNHYPVPELEAAALATRKIGLGMMGLAELLAIMGIPYDSEEALSTASRLARTIRDASREASTQLARERGSFPRFADSIYARPGRPPLRNAQLTSIAPTGTISLIAGTTAGIEPLFAVAYTRNILGRHLVEVNPTFERLARDQGFYTDQLMLEIAHTGSVRSNTGVPRKIRDSFVTALELSPLWHLRMQAAVQRHVDAAVSKTINLPQEATVADISHIFTDAWRARVKGITIYRYGSRPGQMLTLVEDAGATEVRADAAYSGGCAGRDCEF